MKAAKRIKTMSTVPGPCLRAEAGFSLIELLVALVVTMIVSGAIYGLLASGQSAFRREPELSDRQQNIRIAMSLIERDVARAGLSMPVFTQAFTPGLDGGAAPDALEMIAGLENCPPLLACKGTGPPAVIELPSGPPVNSVCPTFPGLAAVTPGPTAAPNRELFMIGQVASANAVTCDPAAGALYTGLAGVAGGSPVGRQITITPGPPEWRPVPPGVTDPGVQLLFPVEVIRYQIVPDPTDTSDPGVPCLFRSVTGGRTAPAYAAVNPPMSPAGVPDPAWQMVARGIEDLQIQYTSGIPGAGVTGIDPPVVALNNFTTLVHRVQVTLSARVTAQNLQGESAAVGGAVGAPLRIRGQLTTEIAPRPALVALSSGNQFR